MRNLVIASLLLVSMLGQFHCSTSSTWYAYRAANDNCNCTEYRSADKKNRIEYTFHANYAMSDGLVTTVDIDILNSSHDTLSLGLGTVRVSSRNISYQYNGKFLPLPPLDIPPHHSETVHLTGRSVERDENWTLIAGEQMTITLRGLRLRTAVLPDREVVFIPENPQMHR